MWYERPHDERIEIDVGGHNLVAYSFGTGDEVVLCLNGGPGLPCDYIRDSHSWLADHGYRVIAYDQLGCGESDFPDDMSLWTVPRYARELEIVRQSLGLERVHLLGQSWGTFLAIEHSLDYPGGLKTLVLQNGAGDVPHLVTELERLRSALGPETLAMMLAHETDGTLDHPEYQAAITILNFRHVCRLKEWPAPVKRSLDHWNMVIYEAMQGPNEFTFTGNYSSWNRLEELHMITSPALVTCGFHDELTPVCSSKLHRALHSSTIKIFQNSSHMPFFEEPVAYAETLLRFLESNRG